MTTLSLEKIIQLVAREVVRELERQGVTVVSGGTPGHGSAASEDCTETEIMDMSGYRSPVLTARMLSRLRERTGAVVVPEGTVVTPRAREMIRQRSLVVRYE